MNKINFSLMTLMCIMGISAKPINNCQSVKANTSRESVEIVSKENPAFSFRQGLAPAKGIGNVKWIQLWENGPKFAEYNVGAANNRPEDYGGYYTWGGNENLAGSMIPFYEKPLYKKGRKALLDDSDTATNLWGSNWRMPTIDELNKLNSNCTCLWIDNYNGTGIKGLLCKGMGDYSSCSVFLPAAGEYENNGVDGRGTVGYYWSSTPTSKSFSYYLSFINESQHVDDLGNRVHAYSVRAVLAENIK